MRAMMLVCLSLIWSVTAEAGTTYERSEGGQLERDKAECRMLAATQQQGYFAFGTPAYVAGAALGNAIANGIRQEQFFDNCMVAKGWKAVRTRNASGKSGSKRPWEGRKE